MINKEVIPAFEILLEELEAVSPAINMQSFTLMDAKRYKEAQVFFDKAKAVAEFTEKVKLLKEEWLALKIEETKAVISEPPLSEHPKDMGGKLPKGLRSGEDVFTSAILRALVALGGKATYSELIDRLELDLEGVLNDYDRQPLLSDANLVRWKNTVGWIKKILRDAGCLEEKSPIGIWEITDAGRAAAALGFPKKGKVREGKPTPRAAKKPNVYTKAYHLEGRSQKIKKIFGELQARILSFPAPIEEKISKVYIAYKKNGEHFADIEVMQKAVKIWISPPVGEIEDPLGLCRDVSHLGHHGNGPTEIELTETEHIGYVFEFIKQSFESVGNENCEIPLESFEQAPQPDAAPKIGSRAEFGKFPHGLRTKLEAFFLPILQALVDRGGSAKSFEVLAALEHDMAGVLNAYDWEKLPYGDKIRWQNNVGWAKKPLIDKGYLSASAPIGTWEITAAGRQALAESKKNNS